MDRGEAEFGLGPGPLLARFHHCSPSHCGE